MFGKIGVLEVVLILFVVLLIFGPKRIPSLARAAGKALKEFRKASSDLREVVDEMDAEVTTPAQQQRGVSAPPAQMAANVENAGRTVAGAAGDTQALTAAAADAPAPTPAEPDLDTRLQEKLNNLNFGGSGGGFSFQQSSSLQARTTAPASTPAPRDTASSQKVRNGIVSPSDEEPQA